MGVTGPVALTIAGTDSSGGAGATADLKVFEALGVWGMVAVTAVTVQTSLGVSAVHAVPPAVIAAQVAAVAGDVPVAAAKTGMLGSADAVAAVASSVGSARVGPLVVDPVMVSSHGERLLAENALEVFRTRLLPRAAVVTPNLAEAAVLAGFPVDDRSSMVAAARSLLALGPAAVLVTGGHLGDARSSPDLLVTEDGVEWLEGARLDQPHTHGSGCVLSAAITAFLALGASPLWACRQGKRVVTAAIAAGGPLGGGIGPVDPGGAVRRAGASGF
ncbi:MAG TPA: bifunctional hydroxymethylpyrimidine kinase/phosphomethylpyrimidine kinase [Acidimicrobiales bacterium]|nr:bifunctional hydroxymethylpyrimidine kinase/phosphomethylpyrimidine kinase [Acidimicrobiales bacterium]